MTLIPRVAKSTQILKTSRAELFFAGPDEWRSENLLDYGKFVTIDEVIDQRGCHDVPVRAA